MELILDNFKSAFGHILHLDVNIMRIFLLSLIVSGTATAISAIFGIMIGAAIALSKFRGKRLLLAVINTGMGLPPVVVGLFVVLFLWRNGPFGSLHIIYTPWAMILAQVIISLPMVVGITIAGFQQIPVSLQLQVISLGAKRLQFLGIMIRESRVTILAAVMAGFGAVISEVGASMMTGGNISGQTRVLTTAIVSETNKGEFDMAIALAIILLIVTFVVNLAFTFIQQKDTKHEWKIYWK
ncbi:MAG: ABC transporter permease [Planctomycetes bacterium]|nr:ABC transporter permease [Planctomycetota bacterium]